MPAMDITKIDLKIIRYLRVSFLPSARIALFIVFFWFGLIKLMGLSAASPLALVLTERTVGAESFGILFAGLALIECVIGVLILFPQAVRITIPLLLAHMIIVSSPLILVMDHAWQAPFVPTLEGQYIIKNIAVVALAIGIAAHTTPLKNTKN